MTEQKSVIVIIAILIISNCITSWYANSYHTQVVELETENQRLLNNPDCSAHAERINGLEHTIEVIVMERTMYIELSFAEIQRLRAELNATVQLLLELNFP